MSKYLKIEWHWRRWGIGICLMLGHKKEEKSVRRRWKLTIGLGPLLVMWDVWPVD